MLRRAALEDVKMLVKEVKCLCRFSLDGQVCVAVRSLPFAAGRP